MTSQQLCLPPSRVPDPLTAPGVSWGVIAPGNIAAQFTDTVHRASQSRVVAVAGRNEGRAQVFAAEHGVQRAHASVSDLLADDRVEIVYIASPHAQHYELARQALSSGKPVLVEKPFTLNAHQARALQNLARQQGLFLMEAMWMRFLPQFDVLRQILADGLIGDVVTVLADHGQMFPPDPSHRLYAPELGGGALLDLGVYPVSFAQMVLGQLSVITSVSSPAMTGVDAQSSIIACGPHNAHALLSTTLSSVTPTRASVSGTLGRVDVAAPFYTPGSLSVALHSGRTAEFSHPGSLRDGMVFEAAEAARCLRHGLLESSVMSWADTVQVMEAMDAVRARAGILYPGENSDRA
ncbi:Gfo/Idh/MocA family protein [Devriesea agamarum]|uniref:Gfo/Idh/MocA family protein n=1 Tax=Devriesea agamarum TaxID=472569 RepID=UPI00071DF74B|nr:Gfo/Idh/MocA family oxidoreductase [Devriesea agamarum]